MNTTEQNRKLIEGIFAALERGDSKPFADALAEDVCWSTPGSSVWSRSFQGKATLIDELLGPVRAQLVERVHLRAGRVIADGEHVVVEAKGSALTKRGQRYDNEYCFVFRIANGKLASVTEYLDTELATKRLTAPWAAASAGAGASDGTPGEAR